MAQTAQSDSSSTHQTEAPSRRALIVKLGAIGDVVMAIPAAFELHRSGYAIDWLCGNDLAPLLSLYPWIHAVPVDEGSILRGGFAERLRTLAGVWRRLQPQRYDLCATLYYDDRYRLLTLPVRATRKVRLSTSDRASRLLPGRHHTEEYARILTGRTDTETPFRLPPVPPESLPPNPLPRRPGTHRVVLVPAGARNLIRDDALRRWPVELYAELATALLRGGHEVLLAGGPADRWASPLFAPLGLTDLIGELSLLQTLSLLDSADVTVTHDTGPLHLAGLTRTAIITIFGPTDPRGRLPQRPGCVALWGGEDFACRPCYDGRDYAPCTNNGCMQQVTPAMVLAELEHLLRCIRSGEPLPPPRVIAPPPSAQATATAARPGAPL